jgi:hypothetical protein
MKKLISLFLVLTLVLSLCACGSSSEGGNETTGTVTPQGMQVGYGRANVTPDFSVGLGGYSDAETRRSEGFLDYLYVTCLAVTEGDETLLIFNLDNCACSASVLKKIRETVSPVTGIPEDHILSYATHTHSAPSITHNDNEAAKYKDMFYAGAADAAKAALEDRAPVTIHTGTAELPLKNAVRHYLMADGTYSGSNFGNTAQEYVAHATEGDSRLVLVKFDRIDETKKDIVIANWQAHADHAKANGFTLMSADHPGAMRTKFESETGMLFTYITGAGGNQNPDSKIESEKHHLGMKEYGEMLADEAIKLLPTMKEVGNTGLELTTVFFDAEIDHSWDHMLAQANEVYDLWKSAGKTAGDALGKNYGFTSSYQARAIRSRANKGPSETFELHAFRIGDVGFISSHCEMFSTCGLYVREHSPFETTFICTGNSGYIPDEASYDYRSYESDTGMYAKGTCEKMAEEFVKMLNTIK